MFRITWLHRPFYPLASISQFHWIQTIVWTQTLNIAFFPRISQLNIRDMQFLKEKKKEKRRRQKRLRSWNKLHQCFEDYSVISIRFERCENAQYVLCARLIAVIISCCSFIVLYAYYVCCIHCIHSVLVGVVDCSSFCIGLLPLAFIAPAFQLMFPLKSAT